MGPGTLYRHFPTREELLQAVYRTELEKLAAAEQKFSQTMAPTDALRAWLLLFVDAIAAKQLIAPALNTLLGDPKKVFEASYAKMHQAIRALVKRAVESGEIRNDLDPVDLLRALVGVSNVASARLAAKRQEIGGYPHRRLASHQIAAAKHLRTDSNHGCESKSLPVHASASGRSAGRIRPRDAANLRVWSIGHLRANPAMPLREAGIRLSSLR